MKLFKRIQTAIRKKTSSEQSSQMSKEALAALDENGLYTAISDWFLHQEERKTAEAFWEEMNENARIVWSGIITVQSRNSPICDRIRDTGR